MRLGQQRNGKAAATAVIPSERTSLQDELAAVFAKVRGRSHEERKAGRLALLVTAMQECAIHPSIIDSVIYRARAIAGLGVDSKVLNDRELTASLREKASMVMNYFDPVILSQTGGKDLSIMLGILIEKLQLLEGKPTNILLTREERSNLNDLIPALMNEAKNRGIDMTPMLTGEVTEAVYTEVED